MAADGPRYKQLGNSWAVPHARWVGSRVAVELDRLDRALTDALSLI
jgi:DNA (cytosine-5)-methyltransferase 1